MTQSEVDAPSSARALFMLETERLILRRQAAGDVEALVDLWSDPEVTRYMGGPRERKKLKAIFDETAQEPFKDAYDLWPVLEKDTGRVVGHCGVLDKLVEGSQAFELVYIFSPPVWGRGYATEMAQALKEYTFKAMSLPRLIALIEPENRASARVAEKVGMRFEREIMRPGGELRRLYAIEAPG